MHVNKWTEAYMRRQQDRRLAIQKAQARKVKELLRSSEK